MIASGCDDPVHKITKNLDSRSSYDQTNITLNAGDLLSRAGTAMSMNYQFGGFMTDHKIIMNRNDNDTKFSTPVYLNVKEGSVLILTDKTYESDGKVDTAGLKPIRYQVTSLDPENNQITLKQIK